MNKVKTSKKRIAITTAALVAVGGGAAFAYWTSTGTGTGAAQTGTTEPFTITSTAATGGPLSPGGPSQEVAFVVANPGTGVQQLNNVVVTVANADGSAWTSVAGCSAADYTVGTVAITGGDMEPGATKSGTVTIKMNNLETNQNGCKDADVPLYFSAS
ncbi:hypothetical protein GCM10027404_12810 [Arthrobacter tumbae]|uniref:hypothetical protein n=1 Tax=Arthrobacter tumbae TaxID=163874 RepID=UPI0019594453|nr:hypothetical protein [Arthrobacter tumbae]MBM7782566.1 hypothetical protein [Arthrobacter tumbae]